MDDLRYPIGEFEMPPSLTPKQRVSALAAIAAAPAELRAALTGLSEAQLDSPYRPEGWTIRQVVHHLPDSHMNSYIRFKLGLTENEPTIGVYNEKLWSELPDAKDPIEASLRLLTALHERWVSLLETIDDETWGRFIHHPEWGRLRLDQLLALYDWHSRHHVAHVRSLRDRQGW